MLLAWQRKLTKEGAAKREEGKDGKPAAPGGLSPNTIRLARAPLSGAFKLAVSLGMITQPIAQVPAPRAERRSPSTGRPRRPAEFLGLMEGDRTWPVWAFPLGSGLRIGEFVSLRWPSVDLKNRMSADRGFRLDPRVTTWLPSTGKSRDAVRTIELDYGLADVLRKQKTMQTSKSAARNGSSRHTYSPGQTAVSTTR